MLTDSGSGTQTKHNRDILDLSHGISGLSWKTLRLGLELSEDGFTYICLVGDAGC